MVDSCSELVEGRYSSQSLVYGYCTLQSENNYDLSQVYIANMLRKEVSQQGIEMIVSYEN